MPFVAKGAKTFKVCVRAMDGRTCIVSTETQKKREAESAQGSKTPWRTRTTRIVPENAWCVPYIRPALAGRIGNAPLFPGMTERAALRVHHDAVEALTLNESTLHDWRHTHAVQLLRDGYTAQVAAYQLGHRDSYQVLTRYGRHTPTELDYTPRVAKGARAGDQYEQEPTAQAVG
jgi:integrase